ncbi:MAG: DUF2062 domain-containing protein [Candidatus Omnitrophica bacterium]|nr:DUF2062 domain-containing protein [Candidatus Omnitrophota bacterium]
MFEFINIFKITMAILRSNVSSREVAIGVCLGMFLGFIPLNGPMALFLLVLFLIVKLSRISTLFALPVFKLFYVLGAAHLAERIGSYLLLDVKPLSYFWRWLTGLPIVAYLDLNNTLIMGGLALSLFLSVPVYFIAKKLNIVFRQYLKTKGQDVKFFSWVIGFSSSPAPKQGVISRRFNIRNIVLLGSGLALFHFAVGFFLSPMATSFVVSKVSDYTPAKVTVNKVNVWPLTLSFSINGLKVFDPEKTEMRILKADGASMRVSPLALLAKRVVFSRVSLSGLEVGLEGTPDGSFNIQKLAKKEEAGKAKVSVAGIFDIFGKKKDLFGRVYDLLKKNSSKKAVEEEKAKRKETEKISQGIANLPHGKRVDFRAFEDRYFLEVRKFIASNAAVTIKAEDGTSIDIDRADIKLERLGFDQANGMILRRAEVNGEVERAGTPAGRIEFLFAKSFTKGEPRSEFRARLKDVDVNAVKFIFDGSLPVTISDGKLNMDSTTVIVGEALNSKNNIFLKDSKIVPKGAVSGSFVPMPALCDALNSVNPIELKFDITGTVEHPDFGGFQESLKALVGPYLKNAGEQLKSKGADFLGTLLKR